MGEAFVSVDLNAVQENYRFLAEKSGGVRQCAAVVKADAYGLGLSPVATALWQAGCREFFVATVSEAIDLRNTLPAAEKIFVLHGLSGNEDPETFAAHSLIPILNSLDDIKSWCRFIDTSSSPLEAGLHIDTGMNRLGIRPANLTAAAEIWGSHSDHIALVMSHLACGEEPEHPLNAQQNDTFSQVSALPFLQNKRRSLAASAGIFLGQEYRHALTRPGIALYGVAPRPDLMGLLKPVVRLQAKILQIQKIDAGDSVGYGASYRAERRMRLATVGAGYADGLFRSLSNRGYIMHRGIRLPIVGRVSMDLITLDITDAPDDLLALGDWVDWIGPENPLENLATLAGTIGYEILTDLAPRHRRVYLAARPDGNMA